MTQGNATTQRYRIVIEADAQAIWDAITKPEWTERYGYGGRVEYELKADGRFSHKASSEMKAFGMPDEIITGKVIECDAPRKLVLTWHPLFTPQTTAEPHTTLTYEIEDHGGGISTLTIHHDSAGAPIVAKMVDGGGNPNKGGGGWPWILSDLKTLLETGKRMAG